MLLLTQWRQIQTCSAANLNAVDLDEGSGQLGRVLPTHLVDSVGGGWGACVVAHDGPHCHPIAPLLLPLPATAAGRTVLVSFRVRVPIGLGVIAKVLQ